MMIRMTFVLMMVLNPILIVDASTFPEPFGLSWDMSESDLKKIGFNSVSESDELNILSSAYVPKAWSKGETYAAITYKNKLVKVQAVSKSFTSDLYGSEGKELYNKMKSLLTKKYGIPSDATERIGLKLYDEVDEFYQCLKYVGCGVYLTLFEYGDGIIGLQLVGSSRGEGYLKILYESPAFHAAKREIEKGALSSDADAL